MSKWITPKVAKDAPPPRNITSELNAIAAAQRRFAPQDYELESQFGPQYNRLDIGNRSEDLLGYDDASGVHHPGQLELARTAASTTREGDIADVARLGPQATEAYLAANPWLRGSLDRYNAEATADDPLALQLNQEASDALASHGQLSAQDTRNLDQQSQALFAQNGMTGGNLSVGTTLLSRDAAVRARQAAAQELAARVIAMNADRTSRMGDVVRTNASVLNDPVMTVTGRSGGAGATAALSPLSNNRAITPVNAGTYGQDLFNTNYNAGINLAIQQSNAEANTRSSIAQIASSFSDRRLKKNIVIVGKSPMGIEIAEFEYDREKFPEMDLLEGRFRGAIAQQVQEIKPSAIMRSLRDGYMRVRYSEIDVPLERIGGARKIVKIVHGSVALQQKAAA